MASSLNVLLLLLAVAVCGVLAADCNESCSGNGDCTSDACTMCNADGQCSTGLACNSDCTSHDDCNQTGPCKICRIGKCTSDGECGSFCSGNADCYGAFCHECVNNQCTSQCGGTCGADADCQVSGGKCDQCLGGICQQGGCGSFCVSDGDCANQGNCTVCSFSKCYSDCGLNCTSNHECNDAYTGCGICDANGKCLPGNVCGIFCANNNDCSGECSHCDLETSKCALGAPCGGSCTVDSDCFQGPTGCSVCLGGKCDHPLPKHAEPTGHFGRPINVN